MQLYFSLGGGYDGANCNKILNSLDDLESKFVQGFPQLLPITQCLQNFKQVVNDCFSNDLSSNADNSMGKLKESYIHLMEYTKEEFEYDLPITWKIHILFAHVVPFCSHVGCGLSRFAEQTGEAVHSKFKPTWARYKRNIDHVDHDDAVFSAVSNFSFRRC